MHSFIGYLGWLKSSIIFCSLFDKSNFLMEGIIFYWKSLISGKKFSEKLSFIPKTQVNNPMVKP